MSARKRFTVYMTTRAAFASIRTREAFAWNSAITASTSLVRDYAREQGEPYSGGAVEVIGKPGQPGSVYRRTWTGDRSGIPVTIEFTCPE